MNLSNKLAGFQGKFHFFGDGLNLLAYEEIKHGILVWQFIKTEFHHVLFRNFGVHVINPNLREIGCDDPSCFLIEWQIVVIVLGLFVGCLPIMTNLWFIKRNTETLLFDQYTGFRDVDINPLCIAIATDQLLFELHAFRHALYIEYILKKLDPV